MFDFDNAKDRADTYAFKWERYKDRDIIPCWVADTEFECAPAITEGLVARAKHGVFGYTLPAEYSPAKEAVQRWCRHQYHWDIKPEWLVWTPGVVPAFNMAIQANTQKNEGVIVQSPNYPPLLAAPAINGRKRYCVDTVNIEGRWTLDFDMLERFAALPGTRLFILCNPMNPVGSVLRQHEMDRVAQICHKHDVVVCSDEIHCDLILDDLPHLPASQQTLLTNNSITLMAASKTFNVAGLGTSFAIIPDKHLRERFIKAGAGLVPWVNIMGLIATEMAFTHCDDWYKAQRDYLRGNRDYLVKQIQQSNELNCVSPEATFLLWVDASGLDVKDTQAWAEKRGIGPSPGRDFGAPDHFRLNFGVNRNMLESIANRITG